MRKKQPTISNQDFVRFDFNHRPLESESSESIMAYIESHKNNIERSFYFCASAIVRDFIKGPNQAIQQIVDLSNINFRELYARSTRNLEKPQIIIKFHVNIRGNLSVLWKPKKRWATGPDRKLKVVCDFLKDKDFQYGWNRPDNEILYICDVKTLNCPWEDEVLERVRNCALALLKRTIENVVEVLKGQCEVRVDNKIDLAENDRGIWGFEINHVEPTEDLRRDYTDEAYEVPDSYTPRTRGTSFTLTEHKAQPPIVPPKPRMHPAMEAFDNRLSDILKDVKPHSDVSLKTTKRAETPYKKPYFQSVSPLTPLLEQCLSDASKYTSLIEWKKNSYVNYMCAKRNGWLLKCSEQMKAE